MDVQEAIAYLVAAGYKVSKPSSKVTNPIFVCSSGHAHKTQAAMQKCERPKGALKVREAADYVAAYQMRKSGQTFSAIGEHFGVTGSRATDLFRKAERAAFAKANGILPYQKDGLYARIYDLI